MAPPANGNVKITSRDRVIFPDAGHTKGELADYYAEIAPLLLPFAAKRLVSLVRCPQGRNKKCFFQKHRTKGFGPHVRSVTITEKEGDTEDYIFFEDADGLLECVQMGTIEFHLWGAPQSDVEAPDRLVFDLDPDTGIAFSDVTQAAQDVRRKLSDHGLESFAMLTGGKGVHVVVPLTGGHSWEAHSGFAKQLASQMADNEPGRFTATMSKEKRKGKIFIDWLRNARGSTAIAPYSARARSGGPVAVPIAWEKLEKAPNAHPFSIGDTAELLKRAKHSSLKGWGKAEQRLPES